MKRVYFKERVTSGLDVTSSDASAMRIKNMKPDENIQKLEEEF